jgi:hypothetical protein
MVLIRNLRKPITTYLNITAPSLTANDRLYAKQCDVSFVACKAIQSTPRLSFSKPMDSSVAVFPDMAPCGSTCGGKRFFNPKYGGVRSPEALVNYTNTWRHNLKTTLKMEVILSSETLKTIRCYNPWDDNRRLRCLRSLKPWKITQLVNRLTTLRNLTVYCHVHKFNPDVSLSLYFFQWFNSCLISFICIFTLI